MAKGSRIVINGDPHGLRVTGIIGASFTPKPGMVVQEDPTVTLVGGQATWIQWAGGADGNRPKGRFIVLTEDSLQGKGVGDTYAAGDIAQGYVPLPGDELNMLLADIAGTADSHTKGEILMVKNNSGKLIATTGTPQSAPFQLQETITAPATDTLAWVRFGGF